MAVRHLKRYASWVQTVWGLIVRIYSINRFPHRLNPFEISVVRIRKSAKCEIRVNVFSSIKKERNQPRHGGVYLKGYARS